MTKKECAVVMAQTGVCMLTGRDFQIFHEYIEQIMGRPVYTHELASKEIQEQIQSRSLDDF